MRFLFIHQISKLSKIYSAHLLRIRLVALDHPVMFAVF